jgi:NADPH:quinone reductase
MLLPLLLNKDRNRHGLILKKLAELVDAGKLKLRIDNKTFTLEKVSDAHAYVESGKARGKVVIVC